MLNRTGAAALLMLIAWAAPLQAAQAVECKLGSGDAGVSIGGTCIDPDGKFAQISTEEAVDLSPLAGGALEGLVLRLGSRTDLSVLADLPDLKVLEITEAVEADIATLPPLPKLERFSLHTRGGLGSGLPAMPLLKKLDLYVVEDFDLGFISGMGALEDLRMTSRKKRDLSGLPPSPALKSLTVKMTVFDAIDGVRAAPNLTEMRLTRFDRETPTAADFSPILALTQLESLWLNGFADADLGPVSGAAWLKRFECSHCKLTAASFASGLTNLTSLSLYQNNLTDISPLAGLSKLRVLILSKNPFADIGPVAKMPELSNIQLRHTKVTDLSPLQNLRPNILWLDGTDVTDLSPLSGYGEMTGLSFVRTPVSDLSPLAGVRMKHLNIIGTAVTDTSMIHEGAKIKR